MSSRPSDICARCGHPRYAHFMVAESVDVEGVRAGTIYVCPTAVFKKDESQW